MHRIFPVPKEQAFQREKSAHRWGRWEGREAGGSSKHRKEKRAVQRMEWKWLRTKANDSKEAPGTVQMKASA